MEDKISLGKNTSIWLDTTAQTDYPSLGGDLHTDVAIIGGGIAGLMAAYFLAKNGRKVVVLESERIAAGTTGHTTAKITAAHGLIYNYLLKKFGNAKARIYADANQQAIEEFAAIIKELGIDCDFKRMPAYTYSINEEGIGPIKAEVKAAKSLGLPVSYTNQLSLPYPVAGAIKYENQAQFHPRKFLLALADWMAQNGVKIYEKTRVVKIDKDKTIQTNKGKVSADKIIVASNYPVFDPNSYFARLSARQSFSLAVELDGPVPQGMFYSTEKEFHSMRPQRWQDKELLLVGGELYRTGSDPDTGQRYQNLASWAKEHFPLKEIHYHWTTSDSESGDRVPLIGRMSKNNPDYFVITGFNGWGMTHSVIAGLIIKEEIMGKIHPWSRLYSPSRISSLLTFKGIGRDIGAISTFIKGKVEKKEGAVEDIAKDEAKVVEINGVKAAIYRDEKGIIHAVSAVCTHMGCTVGWNTAEKTWDCPCHGSRYSLDGKVIHGPAMRDLKKLEL